MNRVLARIVGFLDSENRELRYSATRILGELKPKESAVVEALGRLLGEPDPRLQMAALEALERIGPSGVVEAVIPLLDAPGDVGRRAQEVLSGLGSAILTRLKRRFPAAGELGRRRMLTLAARLRGAQGMDLIVAALREGHAEEVLAVGGRMADELVEAHARERNALISRLERFLDESAEEAAPEAIGAALDLLARVVGTASQERLLHYAARGHAPEVRRRALEALARLAPKAELAPGVLDRLLKLLRDPDYTHVVAPAMAVLERTRLTPAQGGPLLKFLGGQDPALRRFAVTALGQLDTPRSAKALLGVLQGDNPDLQKRAAVSLSKLRAAVPHVVAALCGAHDAHTAWVLARILLPHAHRLRRAHVTALAKAAAAWMEPGDARAEAVLTVLRDRHPEALAEAVMARIKRLRRDRRAGEILNLLRPLVREGAALAPNLAYEMALAEVIRGPKDVVREVRLSNVGLQMLEELLRTPDFFLLTRLKRDKSVLLPEEYYLIGSHFAERTYADKAFGGELLRWLVQTFPGDSSAEAAAHKLHMEGFPPPRPPRRRPSRAKKAKQKKKKAPAGKHPVAAAAGTAKKKKTAPSRTVKKVRRKPAARK